MLIKYFHFKISRWSLYFGFASDFRLAKAGILLYHTDKKCGRSFILIRQTLLMSKFKTYCVLASVCISNFLSSCCPPLTLHCIIQNGLKFSDPQCYLISSSLHLLFLLSGVLSSLYLQLHSLCCKTYLRSCWFWK